MPCAPDTGRYYVHVRYFGRSILVRAHGRYEDLPANLLNREVCLTDSHDILDVELLLGERAATYL